MRILQHFSLALLVMLASCTIRLGKGGDDAATDPAGGWGGDYQGGYGGGGYGGGGAGGALSDDVTAVENALANANPVELRKAQLRSQYTGYALAGSISDNYTADMDEAGLQALVDEWAPLLWQGAGEWVDSLDPSTIPEAVVKGKADCVNEHCGFTEKCENWDGAKCIVTACGEGACPACPSIFPLDKLVVDGWCSYTCVAKGQIVAIKVKVKVKLFKVFSACLPLETPVPCEGMCM
jgi:hypothetical protein